MTTTQHSLQAASGFVGATQLINPPLYTPKRQDAPQVPQDASQAEVLTAALANHQQRTGSLIIGKEIAHE